MVRIPGVNDNENPEDMIVLSQNRPSVVVEDTSRLAKIMISNETLRVLLNLPDDVKITSMHTVRGEEETGIYMICDRFERVPQGATAPEMSIEEINSRGLWDSEGN